jgi:hypothetical protein
MQGRTFLRTMLDIFFNNVIVRTITSFVNFCKEQRYYHKKELKFLKKMPLNNNMSHEEIQKTKFLFTTQRTVTPYIE